MTDFNQAVLQSVTATYFGDALAAAAAPGDTVLQVNDAEEFNEDGGELAVNGFPREYDTADHVAGTLTLTAPLPTAADVDDPIDILTATGDVAVEWTAEVNTPGGDETITVNIPTGLVPFFREGDEQEGEFVAIEPDPTDPGNYRIASQPGQEPVLDLTYADPTTVPEAEAVEPPTETVALTVSGDALGLTAVARADLAGTTRLDWYLDGVLLEANTRKGIYRIEFTPTGERLAADTDYSVTVQPSNNAGVGTISGPAVARLMPNVDAEFIRGVVAAGVVLAGAFEVPPFMAINPLLGLVANHSNGTQTKIPADGSGPHFAGTAEFDTVEAKYLRLLGAVSVIETRVALAAGVAAPAVKTRPSVDWMDPRTFTDGESNQPIGTTRGLLDYSPTYWLYSSSLFGGNLWLLHKTTGARVLVANMPADFSPSGGVAKIGSSYYVLGTDGKRSYGWYVYEFDATWTKTNDWLFAPGNDVTGTPAIGGDGTNLFIGYKSSAATQLRVGTYTTSGTQTRRDHLDSSWPGTEVRGIYVGAADLGTARFFVAHRTGVRVYTKSAAASPATQTRVTANEWAGGNSEEIIGLAWDGDRFHTHSLAGRVWHYSKLAAKDSARAIGSSFIDSDASAPDGAHETAIGGVSSYAAPARTWTRIDVQAPNDGGGPNDPDSVGIFVDGHRQPAPAVGVTSAVYDTFDLISPGVTLPSFDNVPGSLGQVESIKGDAAGPYSKIDGNGKERHAKWAQRGRDTAPASGSPTSIKDVVYPVPFDEIPAAMATVRGTTTCYATVTNETATGCRVTVVDRNGGNIAINVGFTWDAQVVAT